jgi:hypothetical protein
VVSLKVSDIDSKRMVIRVAPRQFLKQPSVAG